MLESMFPEDWDEIGSKRAKKGHLVLESTIFSKLAGCQWVKVIFVFIFELQYIYLLQFTS